MEHQIALNNYTDASVWGIKSYQNNTLFLTEWEASIVLAPAGAAAFLEPQAQPAALGSFATVHTDVKQLKTKKRTLVSGACQSLRNIM